MRIALLAESLDDIRLHYSTLH